MIKAGKLPHLTQSTRRGSLTTFDNLKGIRFALVKDWYVDRVITVLGGDYVKYILKSIA